MDRLPMTRLELISFDRIAFAHSLAVPDYSYHLSSHGYGLYGQTPPNGGVLEIGFVEQNPIELVGGQGSAVAEEQSVFIIPPEAELTVRTVGPGLHRHTSVEFLIASRPVQQKTASGRCLDLPAVLPPSRENDAIIACIRSIASARTARLSGSFFEECESLMHLLRLLEERVRGMEAENPLSPGQQMLCRRAKAYISDHISAPIRVQEIADAVGVSKNYLTNIFSRCEGKPLTEYINRLKLAQLAELVRKYGYTLSEAGEQVGLPDSSYVSRIFRRYYNMSFTEYLRASGAERAPK